jgi:hypothetical protein
MGIAFGLHFLVDTGDLRFLMFYGRFSAGTGLDFMLKDYGSEYHCAGSSGPMGINGWYANGQAYAFVMGKVGIKVNLKFYKGTYDILSIGAAAVLQARGPNPFWMKGTVGGYYKILGGLVKGKCRFEVTVGKECQPVRDENLLDDVMIIAGITPANAATNISVFNAPQLAFNIPVGEIFSIADIEGKTHSFRAVLDEFVVLEGSRKIEGILRWNAEKDVVIFDASDVLPGKKKLRIRAKLTFEEKVNGLWTKVKFDGKIVQEMAESSFETDSAPDFIPENNVASSYPLPNQLNFHPKEFDRGFIQLKEGQPYLFTPGKEWIQKIRMTESGSGRQMERDLKYNSRTRQITFTLPDGFTNSSAYRMDIVNIPKQQLSSIDQNIQRVDKEIAMDQSAGSATLTTRSIDGNLDMPDSKSIFTTQFRTSRYNTFLEKMQHISLTPAIRLSPAPRIFQLTSALQGDEFFETQELSVSGSPNLIRIEAVLDEDNWYNQYVYPLVYEGYPLLGWMNITRRNPYTLGIPPAKDIYIVHENTTLHSNDLSQVASFSSERLVYNLGQSVALDFYDLQRHAVNYVADDPSRMTPRLERLVLSPLPHIRYGPYRIRFKYVIPGEEVITSSWQVEIFNAIPDND